MLSQPLSIDENVDQGAEIFRKVVLVLLLCHCADLGHEMIDKLLRAVRTRPDVVILEACLVAVNEKKNILALCLVRSVSHKT